MRVDNPSLWRVSHECARRRDKDFLLRHRQINLWVTSTVPDCVGMSVRSGGTTAGSQTHHSIPVVLYLGVFGVGLIRFHIFSRPIFQNQYKITESRNLTEAPS